MVFAVNSILESVQSIKKDEYADVKPPLWLFWRARRYILVFLMFLGFINTYCLRVNLSVAIVAMTQYYNVTLENGTTIIRRDFDWDTKIQGYLLSSFFYGYIFTQSLGAYLGVKYGGKVVFTVGMIGASILTILSPFVAYINVYLLLTVRIFEGFFEGIIVPSSQSFFTHWAPPLERGRLMTVGLSGTYLGTVICLPMSSLLATHLGWQSIFYIFGGLGLLWCLIWWLLVYDTPSQDPKISQQELVYINSSLEKTPEVKKNVNIPVWRILTSVPVWALAVVASCETWGFYTLLTQLPKFMKYILNFDLDASGLVSALPYLSVAFMVQFAGHISDYIESKNFITKNQLRKIFIGVGFFIQCIFMVLSVHWLSPVTTTICLIMAVGFGGFGMTAIVVNNMDLTPTFAPILTGTANTIATIPGIVSPIITGYIVTDETSIQQWRIIFYISGGIYIFGGVFFSIFGSGNKQSWNVEVENSKNSQQMVNISNGNQPKLN